MNAVLVFFCPKCLSGFLEISSRLELPSDSRSDEIAIQVLRCSKCGFMGLGVYEESRRGGLDFESVDHRGIVLDESEILNIEKKIKKCPKPMDSGCKCSVHRSLGVVNDDGRWSWLQKLTIKDSFKLKIAH